MVRKPDVQYIRFRTDGSSARAVQPRYAATKTKLPKLRRKKAVVIRLDPLAYVGILVSAVMLVLMVVSCFQLMQLQQQADRMDAYVDVLKEEHARLKDTYHSSYDLEDVRVKAQAMGMIPVEQALHVTVFVPAAEPERADNGTWAFLTDIFP